jgi:hypothetical protein
VRGAIYVYNAGSPSIPTGVGSPVIHLGGNEMITRTYLTGFNNNFVKLRVTHPRNGNQDAEQFVQDVRRLLGKCP